MDFLPDALLHLNFDPSDFSFAGLGPFAEIGYVVAHTGSRQA
jgi:hypothetical protein